MLREYWAEGFAEAVDLRPDAWNALASMPEASAPWSRLETLIAVARNESDLDSVEVNELQDRAVADLIDAVQSLYAAGVARQISPSGTATVQTKAGRNDPCPCGSGKKHKRCCA